MPEFPGRSSCLDVRGEDRGDCPSLWVAVSIYLLSVGTVVVSRRRNIFKGENSYWGEAAAEEECGLDACLWRMALSAHPSAFPAQEVSRRQGV